MTPCPPTRQSPARRPDPRQAGITAVLSMMFLLIFGSLAAAMAIVSQGNLQTADSHLKINRSLAAAETGMNLLAYRLEQVTQGDNDQPLKFPGIKTTAGLIHGGTAEDPLGNAYDLWDQISEAMATALSTDTHYHDGLKPYVDADTLGTDSFGRKILMLRIPAIRLEPDSDLYFEATLIPHPLPLSEQPSSLGYDDPFYDRLPYGDDFGDAIAKQTKAEAGMPFVVSEAQPLDGRYIRVKVTGYDGKPGNRVYRSIAMDFRLDKTIPYAVLSRSRVMIGRNVQIRGNIGSLFTETDAPNGHPLQVQSDFIGLNTALNDILSPPNASNPAGGAFHNEVVLNDIDGDNRLNIYNDTETKDLANDPASYDKDGDGFISDFDYFLAAFDEAGSGNRDGRVSRIEFIDEVDTVSQTTAAQLFDLMDTAGNVRRQGYGDDFIDGDDLYAKIRGSISLAATVDDWNAGVSSWGDDGSGNPPSYADYLFKDYLQGLVKPDFGSAALTTADPRLNAHDFTQDSFDTSSFAALASNRLSLDGSMGTDNGGAAGSFEPAGANPREPVPYGATYPYDYYDRPVYRNKVFNNITISKGTNALFENCRFQGVTFIEIEEYNDDENFNYVGMQESDGTQKHPDYAAEINGANQGDTKPFGNNLRFNDCTFEGPLVSGTTSGKQPRQFTHVRNKITFTGRTRFDFDVVTDEEERALYQRSSLLLPHMSVEMGSFTDGSSADETLELSGAVVAGLIDMRGQIRINGTLITTFLPQRDVAPVKGDTSPQFNTTLGYFSQTSGDLEAGDPPNALGQVVITYDPTLALPDGILGPVQLQALEATYLEGGK